jgi:hypothetical protein
MTPESQSVGAARARRIGDLVTAVLDIENHRDQIGHRPTQVTTRTPGTA